MTGAFSRTRWTLIGLVVVVALVTWAALTAPDREPPSATAPAFEWDPCQQVFNLDSDENRLVWFFEQTKFPGDLVALGSGPSQNCSSGWRPQDQEFAVSFVFFEGEGETREPAVWWLLYQPWDDPYRYGARLRQETGGDVEYFDGYVVAFSPDASDEIRQAAFAEPDTDIWSVMHERHGEDWASLSPEQRAMISR